MKWIISTKQLIKTIAVLFFIIHPINTWATDNALHLPEGFTKTKLTPYNGYIAKPTHWFFNSRQTKGGWVWTLSKENMVKNQGFYDTGLRIQTIEEMDEKTKNNFIKSFIEHKKTSSTIMNSCEPVFEKNYEKKCLETIEKIKNKEGDLTKYHILYSFMWMKKYQLLTLTTFGTPEADWGKNTHILNTMAQFSLSGDLPNNEKNNYVAKHAHLDSIILLQNDNVLQKRVTDITAFSHYIKKINQRVDNTLDNFNNKTNRAGYIVLAIRPNGSANAWTDFHPRLPTLQKQKIISNIKQVTPYIPQKGTVVFAIQYRFWNGESTKKPLNPTEWQSVPKGENIEITDLIDTIWQ